MSALTPRARAIRRAEAALRRWGRALLRRDGVVAVGVGPRRRRGRWHEGEVCLQVFVRRKRRPESAIPRRSRLPRALDGVPVDVLEATFRAFDACPAGTASRRRRADVLVGGIALANEADDQFGTLGLLLEDAWAVYALTAGHVAGAEGSKVAQPEDATDRIGTVVASRCESSANLDAALVRVAANARHVAPGVHGTPQRTFRTAAFDATVRRVWVHGACSGRVEAKVISHAWKGTVEYADGKRVALRDQGAFRGIGDVVRPGDSGAAVFDADEEALVGMLVGGDEATGFGVFTPIEDVLGRPLMQPRGERLAPLA